MQGAAHGRKVMEQAASACRNSRGAPVHVRDSWHRYPPEGGEVVARGVRRRRVLAPQQHSGPVWHVRVQLAVPVAVQQRALKPVVALLQEAAYLGVRGHGGQGAGGRRWGKGVVRAGSRGSDAVARSGRPLASFLKPILLPEAAHTWRGSLSKMSPASLNRTRVVSPVLTHRTCGRGRGCMERGWSVGGRLGGRQQQQAR